MFSFQVTTQFWAAGMVRFDYQVMGFTCCCPFLQVPLKSRSWCISWTEMLLLDSPSPPHWKPTRPIPWSTTLWESTWGLKTQCLLVWKWIMRWEELHLPLLYFDLCCSYSVLHLSLGSIGCFCCLGQLSFFTGLLAFCLAFSQNGQVSSVLVIDSFCFSSENMPVFLVWTSLVQLLASLLAPILLLIKTVSQRISFAPSFNPFFQTPWCVLFQEADNDPTGEAAANTQQTLTFYELDLGLNHVVRKYSEPLEEHGNFLITGTTHRVVFCMGLLGSHSPGKHSQYSWQLRSCFNCSLSH